MGDPDADNDDEFEDQPDYYSILNLRKDANDEEIKTAYRRMCVMFHPDKHRDPKNKQTAESIFSKVHKAYEVLSVPQTRMIYDIYGQKGLDAGWEVIERRRTPQEIRAEYDRLQREADERRVEQRTNPKGSITLQIDATDLFTNEDDPYYQNEISYFPNIEITGMSFNQSIDAPLTRTNTATLSGTLHHTNGNGSGNVSCCLRRVFQAQESWGEMEIGAGNGGTLRLKGFRNIDKKRFGTISIDTSIKQSRLVAGLQAMVASQLTKNTMGYLSWNVFYPSSMTSTISKNTENYKVMGQLQIGIPNSFGLFSYTHKLGQDTKIKGLLKYGALGLVLEYGCEHKMTSLSNVGATMSIGQNTGVTLKLTVHRHTQTFDFPILLCEVISPAAIFYGTIGPMVAFLTIKALIISPMIRQQKEKDIQETREKHAQLVAEKRREAESAVNLMLGTYEQIVESEESRHGLVIQEAWYGKFISKHRQTDKSTPYVISVTIPIQCLVKDSKLLLGDSSKSQISGFYDPCIGEEKLLKIIYEFRDNVHEAIFKDDEAVRIPKQSHKISTKIS